MSGKPTPRVLNARTDGIPRGAVYVGRPSVWGNPYRIAGAMSRGLAVYKYLQLVKRDPEMVARAKERLRGKDLVCWCAPKPCHADVLLEVAND